MADAADHGARDHATWSASATARNWHCAGALALSAGAPHQPESMAAARGTACHQISEACLRSGAEPSSFFGTVQRTKEHAITIDDELVASATVYVDYVRARADVARGEHVWTGENCRTCDGYCETSEGLACPSCGGTGERIRIGRLLIEQRFSLADLHPPFDAGGTADAVIFFPEQRLLEVVDLKNGMGIVEARDNPQLRTYGLGALLAQPGLDVERVRVTIVQPRAPLRGEIIRSDEFHVADLIEWTADLLDAMCRSRAAMDALAARGGKPNAPWIADWLRPGCCKFCPREATCPALDKEGGRATTAAALWFETPISAEVLEGEPQHLADLLGKFELVENWIKAKRARAHRLADGGVEIPGYRLVETNGHRKWRDAEAITAAALAEVGLAADDIYDRDLKSPAAVEKLLPGKQRKESIAGLWIKPVTGKTLVRATSTDRPTVPSRAETYFEPQE